MAFTDEIINGLIAIGAKTEVLARRIATETALSHAESYHVVSLLLQSHTMAELVHMYNQEGANYLVTYANFVPEVLASWKETEPLKGNIK